MYRYLFFSAVIHLWIVGLMIFFLSGEKKKLQPQPYLSIFLSPASELIKKNTPPQKKGSKIKSNTKAKPARKKILLTNNKAPVKKSTGKSNGLVIRLKPQLLSKDIKVAYPKKARHFRVEGNVRLELLVAKSGLVVETKILSGPGFGLKEAALSVVKQLSFLPATNQWGKPIDARIEHEVLFKLNDV